LFLFGTRDPVVLCFPTRATTDSLLCFRRNNIHW